MRRAIVRRPVTVLPHGGRGRSFRSIAKGLKWAERWARACNTGSEFESPVVEILLDNAETDERIRLTLTVTVGGESICRWSGVEARS
jgi:hypothetical protein